MGVKAHMKSTLKVAVIALVVSYLINETRKHYGYADLAPGIGKCRKLTKTHEKKPFTTFDEFYPFYLCEHTKPATKLFHFVGTALYLADLATFLSGGMNQASPQEFKPVYLLTAAAKAYGLAWTSHFFIEKNKPATFKYPGFSFVGDHYMFMDLARMKLRMW